MDRGVRQLSFFDTIEEPKEEIKPEYQDYALVYLVTFGGGNQGNLFVLKTDDAKKLCSDKCSYGRGRGGEWFFCWTTLDHFAEHGEANSAARQYEDVHRRLPCFVFIKDTGKQDNDFARLGIEKPTRDEQSRIMRELGYLMIEK